MGQFFNSSENSKGLITLAIEQGYLDYALMQLSHMNEGVVDQVEIIDRVKMTLWGLSNLTAEDNKCAGHFFAH